MWISSLEHTWDELFNRFSRRHRQRERREKSRSAKMFSTDLKWRRANCKDLVRLLFELFSTLFSILLTRKHIDGIIFPRFDCFLLQVIKPSFSLIKRRVRHIVYTFLHSCMNSTFLMDSEESFVRRKIAFSHFLQFRASCWRRQQLTDEVLRRNNKRVQKVFESSGNPEMI